MGVFDPGVDLADHDRRAAGRLLPRPQRGVVGADGPVCERPQRLSRHLLRRDRLPRVFIPPLLREARVVGGFAGVRGPARRQRERSDSRHHSHGILA